MKLEIGDLFWLEVTYPKTLEREIRPVVIYDFEDDLPVIVSFATITGEGIGDFDQKYDKWKIPIFGWKNAGLKKASYVKVNTIAIIKEDIFNENDYIGRLSEYDLINVMNKINEFIESGEAPW